MKRFDDFFYDSENHKGFLEVFENFEPEKFVELMGTYTELDLIVYDRYIKANIGFLPLSPVFENIYNQKGSPLEIRQVQAINLFLLLHYKELIKVKDMLNTEIFVNNGTIRKESKNTVTKQKNDVSAFNSDDLEENSENNFSSETDNTITEKRNNVGVMIKNINTLSDFYKKSIIDKIIDSIKYSITLQIYD